MCQESKQTLCWSTHWLAMPPPSERRWTNPSADRRLLYTVESRKLPNYSPVAHAFLQSVQRPQEGCAEYCDEHVCLSVRLHIAKTTLLNFTKFSTHLACTSVLLWQQRNVSCISVFFWITACLRGRSLIFTIALFVVDRIPETSAEQFVRQKRHWTWVDVVAVLALHLQSNVPFNLYV